MAVSRVNDTFAENVIFRSKFRKATMTMTLSATLVVGADFSPVLILDPGGAGRNVDLPAVAGNDGLMFTIINTADAAETLTVRDAAAATIATIPGSAAGATNSRATFICNGVAWFSLGVAADN